jgi:hypothetical protein
MDMQALYLRDMSTLFTSSGMFKLYFILKCEADGFDFPVYLQYYISYRLIF